LIRSPGKNGYTVNTTGKNRNKNSGIPEAEKFDEFISVSE